MSDLLKEAIADAKTVRETAIANAKMALEEAFTPHLKSMLSAKLAEDDMEDEEEMDIALDDEEAEDMARSNYREEDDEIPMDEPEMEPEMGDEEEMEEEGVIEINGVKYAPVVSEEEEEIPGEEEEEGDIDLDLEAVIKELETEIAESEKSDEESVNEEDDKDDKDDEVNEYGGTKAEKRKKDGNVHHNLEAKDADGEEVNEAPEDDDETVDEQSPSSGIGTGDNVQPKGGTAADEEDPGKGKDKPMSNESVNAMQKELNEYKEAVSFLREKLHEVNILNAKLLYTNRLFKEYVLSNDQKLKIVETFDRAQTTREIKLVYSTLAENFKNGEIKKTRVQESASQKTGTTKPTKKIITEEDQVANRFKKLAGIL